MYRRAVVQVRDTDDEFPSARVIRYRGGPVTNPLSGSMSRWRCFVASKRSAAVPKVV